MRKQILGEGTQRGEGDVKAMETTISIRIYGHIDLSTSSHCQTDINCFSNWLGTELPCFASDTYKKNWFTSACKFSFEIGDRNRDPSCNLNLSYFVAMPTVRL